MKILFVAFEFPPLATSGVHRSLRFAKYLPEWGITPIVVTPDIGTLESIGRLDPSLLDELPPDVTIERIACDKLAPKSGARAWASNFFSLWDGLGAAWRRELEARLPELIEKHAPEAIYVSLPPFSMAPLWRELAARHNLPLVLDFRDLWSGWGSDPQPSKAHYLLTRAAEERCLQSAARVICATSQVRADLLAVHPRVAPDKLVAITSGYDEAVEDWTIPPKAAGAGARDEFVIGYVGAFYYTPAAREAMMAPWWTRKPHRMLHYSPRLEDWLYRSPYFFFRALAHLFAARPDLRPRVKVRFAGRKPDWIDAQVREFGLESAVEFLGQLGHRRCLDFQAECDCLLMTSAKVVGGLDYCISSKTFEYFVARKPILALVTAGTQRDILERSGMAFVCDPDDTPAAAARIEQIVEGHIELHPDATFLSTLHRRELTGALAAVLRDVQGSAKLGARAGSG